jgi:hypothetical protein
LGYLCNFKTKIPDEKKRPMWQKLLNLVTLSTEEDWTEQEKDCRARNKQTRKQAEQE